MIDGGDNARGAFGEHARLCRSNTRHVTDRVHAGEARLEVLRIDGDPAILGHAARRDHVRDAMLRDTEEQVVGHLTLIVKNGNAARRVERAHEPIGNEGDAPLGEGGEQRFGGCRRRRDRDAERHDEADLAGVAHTACGEMVVQQQRGFARRGRALERG